MKIPHVPSRIISENLRKEDSEQLFDLMWFSFGREENCCLGRQFWEVFFLAILGSVLWIASSGQKRGLLSLHFALGCNMFWKRSSVRWKRRWVISFLGRWEVLGFHWPNMKFLWEVSKLVASWGVRCCTDCRQMGFKRPFHLSCLFSAKRKVALFSLWRFWSGSCRCVCSLLVKPADPLDLTRPQQQFGNFELRNFVAHDRIWAREQTMSLDS